MERDFHSLRAPELNGNDLDLQKKVSAVTKFGEVFEIINFSLFTENYHCMLLKYFSATEKT